MFATLVTLSLFAGTVGLLVSMARANGDKILAALNGSSWSSQTPMTVRANPVTVRFQSRYRREAPVKARVEWRAAA
nr:hypothetical protein [uncultured Sphingomonas sp.]